MEREFKYKIQFSLVQGIAAVLESIRQWNSETNRIDDSGNVIRSLLHGDLIEAKVVSNVDGSICSMAVMVCGECGSSLGPLPQTEEEEKEGKKLSFGSFPTPEAFVRTFNNEAFPIRLIKTEVAPIPEHDVEYEADCEK